MVTGDRIEWRARENSTISQASLPTTGSGRKINFVVSASFTTSAPTRHPNLSTALTLRISKSSGSDLKVRYDTI